MVAGFLETTEAKIYRIQFHNVLGAARLRITGDPWNYGAFRQCLLPSPLSHRRGWCITSHCQQFYNDINLLSCSDGTPVIEAEQGLLFDYQRVWTMSELMLAQPSYGH